MHLIHRKTCRVTLVAGIVLRAPDEIAAARPRYWLVPSHAPPSA